MTRKTQSRATQVGKRPLLGGVSAGDSLGRVVQLVNGSEEPRRLFSEIVECALNSPGIVGAALFLPLEEQEDSHSPIAVAGQYSTTDGMHEYLRLRRQAPSPALPKSLQQSSCGNHHYFDVVSGGRAVGALAVESGQQLMDEVCEKLANLAFYASVTFERFRLSGLLQHYLDRLQVLTDLNQLIAGNFTLARLFRSLAHGGAYSFSADLSLALLLSDDQQTLSPRGFYGCAETDLPTQLSLEDGILVQVLRQGGQLTLSSAEELTANGLTFLLPFKLVSVELCCLTARDQPLGVLLFGYKREMRFGMADRIRIEEFAQGGAVALATILGHRRLAAYAEKLEDLVEDRTAEMAIQIARADEANHAKSQFLANMSHELRTPLTAIVGYSSVLLDGLFGPMTGAQLEALKAIGRSGDDLKELIDDVLSLARVESGKEMPEGEVITIREIFDQIAEQTAPLAEERGLRFKLQKLPKRMAETAIIVDRRHVQQILMNLLSNALKFTPAGGEIEVLVEPVVDKMQISVRDTGVGMSEDQVATAFERFERGQDTYTKQQLGSGVGLNLTKRLVELNGGRIGVVSQLGVGSIFWVMLPLADNFSVVVTQKERKESQVRLDGLSVLVVDDNSDTLEVLRQILMAAGAGVATATSVAEGLGRFYESNVDIILTDLAMPEQSGLDLIEQIKSLDDTKNRIPIVVLSACSYEADQQAALQAGAALFIPKPFKPTNVLEAVRQLTLDSAMDR